MSIVAVQPKYSSPAWIASQKALRELLNKPGHPPVLNLESQAWMKPQDLLMSCRGMDFLHSRTATAVKWVRPIKKTPIWQHCWRTTEASVIPIGEDWGKPTEWKAVEGNIKSLFDQIPA